MRHFITAILPALLIAWIGPSAGYVFPPNEPTVPEVATTGFIPQLDMLPAATPDECAGAAALSVIHFPAAQRDPAFSLAKIGRDRGEAFQREIIGLAHQNAPLLVHQQTRLNIDADTLFDRIRSSHQPQLMAFQWQRDPNRSHEVVVFEAQRTADRVVFRIGDPAAPTDRARTLTYDARTRIWEFQGGGRTERLAGTWTPWDVRQDRIPNRDVFEIISREMRTGATLQTIRNRVYVERAATPAPRTGLAFPRLPNIGEYKAEAARVRQFLESVRNLPRHLQMNHLLGTSPMRSGFGGVVLGSAPVRAPQPLNAKFLWEGDRLGIVIDTPQGTATFGPLSPTEAWVAHQFVRPDATLREQGAAPGDFGLVGILRNNQQQDGTWNGTWDFSLHPALANTFFARQVMRLDMVLTLTDPRLPAMPPWSTYRWNDEPAAIAVEGDRLIVRPGSGTQRTLMRVRLWTKDAEVPFDMTPYLEKYAADFDALQSIDRLARAVAVMHWLNEAGKLPDLPSSIRPTRFEVPNTNSLEDLAFRGVRIAFGALTKDDPFDEVRTQSHAKKHAFPMAARTLYVVDLRGHGLDPFLRIQGPEKALGWDDDSAGHLNSRIIFEQGKEGTYDFIATTFAGGAVGNYCLVLWEGNIGPGHILFETYGRLEAGDPRDAVRTDSPHRLHKVFLDDGVSYDVQLRSKDFDAYLRVEDEKGNQLGFDDDGGGGRDSLFTFTANRTGWHRVIATTYRGGAGNYVLTVRRSGGPRP